MSSRARIGLILAFFSSVGAHGVAYASLAGRHDPAPRDFVSEVSIEVAPPPPATAIPEPPPPPESAPSKPIERAVRPPPSTPPAAAAKPAPSVTAAAPAAPSPALDLSGVTLTNDSGIGFAIPVGDGSALHGPIAAGKRSADFVPKGDVASVATGPALIAARDLSVHPVPPALGGLLRSNYPEQARQRGLRGSASVRARIDADGVVRAGRVVSETSDGFGAACRRTVVGSHWSAPRDKNGSAVATEIVYTCHFEVDQ